MYKTRILKASLLESLTRTVVTYLQELDKLNKQVIDVSYLCKDKLFIAIITFKENGK